MVNRQEVMAAISQRSSEQLKDDYYDIIKDWKSWYRGNVEDFHNYDVKLVDGTTKSCEMLSLQMAKKVCEDMTDLLWSEKVKINIEDENASYIVHRDLFRNNFQIEYGNLIEKTMALGTGVTIEYVYNNEVRIDYLEADLIVPWAWANQQITGLTTLSQFKRGEYWYNHLVYHYIENNIYYVEHELYKSKDEYALGDKVSANEVNQILFNGENEEYITVDDTFVITFETLQPFFQVIRPNVVNNLEFRFPMGISLFANSSDTLKAIDTKYDSFTNEFSMGRKRILVSYDAIKRRTQVNTETGDVTYISNFDTQESVFQGINLNGESMKEPVKEIDFTLRSDEHIQSINQELDVLGTKVGLGNNYYEFDARGLKTATEVVSENSILYRSKSKHQQIIEKALIDLVYSILYLEKNVIEEPTLQNTDINDIEVKINFDDSIVQDKDKEMENGLNEVNAGVMSKYTYLTKVKGLTDEEAEEELSRLATINQDTQMTWELNNNE